MLVRQRAIAVAPGLIETAGKLARAELPDYQGDKSVLQAMLRLVSPVIDLRDDSAQEEGMKPELTLSERVNAIQNDMFSAAISPAQAERW